MKTFLIYIIISLSVFAQTSRFFKVAAYYNNVGLKAETIEYKRLIDSVGGSITAADLAAIDVFVSEISSIRSKIVRFNPFGGDNLTTALVPLFRGESTGKVYGNVIDVNSGTTVFQSSDYTRTSGLGTTPNANSSKYINTGFIPSTITAIGQNDFSFGVYLLGTPPSGGFILGAIDNVGSKSVTIIPNITGYSRVSINSEAMANGAVAPTEEVLILGSRTSSDKHTVYYNSDSVYTYTTASTGKPALALLIMGYNNNGTPGYFTPQKSTGYIIAKGLTTADVVVIYNAWNKLKIAWGR